MKRNKFAALIAFVLLGSVLSLDASADRGGHHGHGGHFGIFIDPWPSYSYYPYYRPYAYYPRYYEYPAVVAAPVSPPVYIERDDNEIAQSDPASPAYWYYCNKPKGYYPYVRECRSGWQKVPSQPDDQ